MNKQTPFWLLTCAVICGLTLPVLFRDGMFMDAILYTAVSKNLANGIGTFWFPKFSYCGIGGLPTFHEHPPLVFGIQALFFKLLGNSIYTERLYTVLTGLFCILLMVYIWKKVTKPEQQALGWWPLLLWISIPVCFWSYQNNMQENTMVLFILLSFVFYWKVQNSSRFTIVQLFCSAFFVLLAALSKGLPGFFTLALPFLYWLTMRKITFSKMLVQTALLLFFTLGMLGILLWIPESSKSLQTYFFKRVLHRLAQDPTVTSHFYIVGRLISELLPSIAITLIVGFVAFRKFKIRPSNEQVRLALFFISIGCCGALPIMLTMVQKGFCFVPALPFFGIGLALLASEGLAVWFQHVQFNGLHKTLTAIAIVLLIGVGGVTYYLHGTIWREKETMHDIHAFEGIIPANTVIGAVDTAWSDWTLETGMMRYNSVSLVNNSNQFDYFLAAKPLTKPVPEGFALLPLPTVKYDLYRRIQH